MTRKEHQALWADPAYIKRVEAIAAEIDADGCTGVPDFYLLGCLEHDIAYRLHRDPIGDPISKPEADIRFRWYIQHHSWFGLASPMAWWRWAAVKWFANKAWHHEQL